MRALSDRTIRQTYTVLRAGLDGAVRDGLLARNPAARSNAQASNGASEHWTPMASPRCWGRRGFPVSPRAGADRLDRVAQRRGAGLLGTSGFDAGG